MQNSFYLQPVKNTKMPFEVPPQKKVTPTSTWYGIIKHLHLLHFNLVWHNYTLTLITLQPCIRGEGGLYDKIQLFKVFWLFSYVMVIRHEVFILQNGQFAKLGLHPAKSLFNGDYNGEIPANLFLVIS